MSLKQNTAITLKLGAFVDDGDGVTAENGLTITQADVRLSKNGGAFAQKNNAVGCAIDEQGFYGCQLNATDTNTLGRLLVAVYEGGALRFKERFMVMTANAWDTLYGADAWDVNAATGDAAFYDALWDEVVEGTLTAREVLMVIFAQNAGKSTGGGTNTISFRDEADGKNTIVATVDAAQNRTAVVLDVTP